PLRLDKTRRNGAATLERPDTQTFWVSRSSKSPAELDWRIADGSYRLVVMKTDGTSGVDLNARLGVTIPHLYGIGTGVLIGGLAGEIEADLVLMDVNLPGINGIEASRVLTTRPKPPIVVLLSTYDEGELDYDDCGAAAYITKSAFDPGRLADVWAAVNGRQSP